MKISSHYTAQRLFKLITSTFNQAVGMLSALSLLCSVYGPLINGVHTYQVPVVHAGKKKKCGTSINWRFDLRSCRIKLIDLAKHSKVQTSLEAPTTWITWLLMRFKFKESLYKCLHSAQKYYTARQIKILMWWLMRSRIDMSFYAGSCQCAFAHMTLNATSGGTQRHGATVCAHLIHCNGGRGGRSR
jgi:hypothetical protein